MGYSDEWKYILREELPLYMDARIDHEPFPLVVPSRLLQELTKASGTLTFTPQIIVDGVNYHFKASSLRSQRTFTWEPVLPDWHVWHLYKTVRDTRPSQEWNRPGSTGFSVAGWYSTHIATVTASDSKST